MAIATAIAAPLALAVEPAALRSLLVASVVVLASHALWRQCQRQRVPDAVRIDGDGRWSILSGNRWRTVGIAPGSILLPQFGLLLWRGHDGERGAMLVCARDNRPVWRRLQVLWRWGGDAPPRAGSGTLWPWRRAQHGAAAARR